MGFFSTALVSSIIVSFALRTFYPNEFSTVFHAAVLAAPIGFFFSFVYMCFVCPFVLSPLRHLPQPKGGHFLHGHFNEFAKLPYGFLERDFVKTVPNDGLIVYRGLFNQERLIVTNGKVLQELLVKKPYDFVKPLFMLTASGRFLGKLSIVMSEGEEHKVHRKVMTPAFHQKVIRDFFPLMWEKTSLLSTKIADILSQPQTEGVVKKENYRVVNISDLIHKVTLDVIGAGGFDFDFNSLEGKNSEITEAFHSAFTIPENPVVILMFKINRRIPILHHLARLPLRSSKRLNHAGAMLRKLSDTIINGKVMEYRRLGKDGKDLVSVMARNESYSTPQLRDQIGTFLAAGHDTTASTLSFAFIELVKNPLIQDRLRAEVRAAIPSRNTPVDLDLIESLPYLRNFVYECIRYWPAVPATFREPLKDTTLNGIRIPKGTTVTIPTLAMNRSEELWGPTAETFDPDRWEDPHGGAQNNFAMTTFLHGPRNCIGKDFARQEMKVILAVLLARFEFLLCEGEHMEKVSSGLTIKPTGGVKVYARELEW